jgi:hypothetical protein
VEAGAQATRRNLHGYVPRLFPPASAIGMQPPSEAAGLRSIGRDRQADRIPRLLSGTLQGFPRGPSGLFTHLGRYRHRSVNTLGRYGVPSRPNRAAENGRLCGMVTRWPRGAALIPPTRSIRRFPSYNKRQQSRPQGGTMAQVIESIFICDGRFRLFTIQPMGRKIGRIIEIEEVDTGKRVHGTARKLERLALALRRSNADADGVPA